MPNKLLLPTQICVVLPCTWKPNLVAMLPKFSRVFTKALSHYLVRVHTQQSLLIFVQMHCLQGLIMKSDANKCLLSCSLSHSQLVGDGLKCWLRPYLMQYVISAFFFRFLKKHRCFYSDSKYTNVSLKTITSPQFAICDFNITPSSLLPVILR